MLRTAESVSPMHPDKLCDRISDAILDACLALDPSARCAVETMGGHGKVFITGEVTTGVLPELSPIVTKIAGKVEIISNLVHQSPEIAQGVDRGGAGDQGIMVGYACRDNSALIPHEHYLARSLCRYLHTLHPDDGKTQITLDGDSVSAVVASWRGISSAQLHTEVQAWSEQEGLVLDSACNILCNPAGDWEQGGFDSDAGLTGRKVVVDAYGPRIPVGGGAFSGKDCTKVDRSGAYRARQLAVTLLEKNPHVREVQVQVAYAIGEKYPVEVSASLDGKDLDFTAEYRELFTPARMAEDLGLRTPQFEQTAQFGHFGNGFAWDRGL